MLYVQVRLKICNKSSKSQQLKTLFHPILIPFPNFRRVHLMQYVWNAAVCTTVTELVRKPYQTQYKIHQHQSIIPESVREDALRDPTLIVLLEIPLYCISPLPQI